MTSSTTFLPHCSTAARTRVRRYMRDQDPERAGNIERHRKRYALRLNQDYFCSSPTYTDHLFQRRFRVSKAIFFRLCSQVLAHNRYFVQNKDSAEHKNHTIFQKVAAAISMLAYGCAAEMMDETMRIAESTALCLYHFALSVVAVFIGKCSRTLREEETRNILLRAEKLMFPEMLGSIDFCKWLGKNKSLRIRTGSRRKKKASLSPWRRLQMTTSISGKPFGISGSNNDLTVFQASTLPEMMSAGTYPQRVEFFINGQICNKPYLLAGGIYPKASLSVYSIISPASDEESFYAARQEGRRKNIARAFGVL